AGGGGPRRPRAGKQKPAATRKQADAAKEERAADIPTHAPRHGATMRCTLLTRHEMRRTNGLTDVTKPRTAQIDTEVRVAFSQSYGPLRMLLARAAGRPPCANTTNSGQAQAAAILDQARTPPQGDGQTRPPLTCGAVSRERDLIVLDAGYVAPQYFRRHWSKYRRER